MDRKERYYMSSVRLGPKGQIVIPKEARDLFHIQSGDTLLFLADEAQGMAIPSKADFARLFDLIFGGKAE